MIQIDVFLNVLMVHLLIMHQDYVLLNVHNIQIHMVIHQQKNVYQCVLIYQLSYLLILKVKNVSESVLMDILVIMIQIVVSHFVHMIR
jgi:hypothetical protein